MKRKDTEKKNYLGIQQCLSLGPNVIHKKLPVVASCLHSRFATHILQMRRQKWGWGPRIQSTKKEQRDPRYQIWQSLAVVPWTDPNQMLLKRTHPINRTHNMSGSLSAWHGWLPTKWYCSWYIALSKILHSPLFSWMLSIGICNTFIWKKVVSNITCFTFIHL